MKPTQPLISHDEFCSICNRVQWGQVVPLGFSHWRHTECAIGSEAWRDYYLALTPVQQRPLREFFDFYYPQLDESHIGDEEKVET